MSPCDIVLVVSAGHGLYGPQDVRIRCAPAQISRQIMPDLFGCGVWMTLQEFFCHEYEAGRAKAALETTVLDEGSLNRVQFVSGRKTFDRDYFSGIHKSCQIQTAGNGYTIHDCCAAPAQSLAATFPAAEKTEIATQHFH